MIPSRVTPVFIRHLNAGRTYPARKVSSWVSTSRTGRLARLDAAATTDSMRSRLLLPNPPPT